MRRPADGISGAIFTESLPPLDVRWVIKVERLNRGFTNAMHADMIQKLENRVNAGLMRRRR
jgi:hypothetical protein